MAKAILFDLEGTLIDMAHSHVAAYNEILEGRYSFMFGMGDLIPHYGMHPWRIVQIFLSKNGISASEKECRLLADEKQAVLRAKYTDRLVVLPGVRTLLEALKKNPVRLAIASSTPRQNVKFMLENPRLRGFFDVVVDGDDVKNAKPNPEVFIEAAMRLGVAPKDCVVVEDSLVGIQAAKAAGMKVVAVATGGRTMQELRAQMPDLVYEDLAHSNVNEIISLLDKAPCL
jgi:beta-phosphoglucomutase